MRWLVRRLAFLLVFIMGVSFGLKAASNYQDALWCLEMAKYYLYFKYDIDKAKHYVELALKYNPKLEAALKVKKEIEDLEEQIRQTLQIREEYNRFKEGNESAAQTTSRSKRRKDSPVSKHTRSVNKNSRSKLSNVEIFLKALRNGERASPDEFRKYINSINLPQRYKDFLKAIVLKREGAFLKGVKLLIKAVENFSTEELQLDKVREYLKVAYTELRLSAAYRQVLMHNAVYNLLDGFGVLKYYKKFKKIDESNFAAWKEAGLIDELPSKDYVIDRSRDLVVNKNYTGVSSYAMVTLPAFSSSNLNAYKEARRLYEEAKGEVYRGMFITAKDKLRHALRLKPIFPEAYNLLGIAEEFTNDYQTAMKMYYKAYLQNPQMVEALYNLARLYYKLGNLDEAYRLLKANLSKVKNNYKALLLAAQIFMAREDWDNAYVTLKFAGRMSRGWDYYFWKGFFYWRKGNAKKAVDNWKKALRLTNDEEVKSKIRKMIRAAVGNG